MKEKAVIIALDPRGLYYGRISASDAEIIEKKAVRVSRCRHISYWVGGPGGITSLAATGPSKGSRIGNECSSALVTSVKNVYDVSEEAEKIFDLMPASSE